MSTRDKVLFSPDQRVDRGDLAAIQDNSRSDTRKGLEALVFGGAGSVVISGFEVSVGSSSDEVDIAAGLGVGAAILAGPATEYGVVFGSESPSVRTVSLGALGTGTYTVYVRFTSTPGAAGNRVFYNSTTDAEEVDTVNTREVVSWGATVASSSPGADWVAVATVDWDGAAVLAADITPARALLFEGDEANDFPKTEWGDGANDRNTDRTAYPVTGLETFLSAVRRQLADVVDNNTPANGGTAKWFTALDSITKTARLRLKDGATTYWDVVSSTAQHVMDGLTLDWGSNAPLVSWAANVTGNIDLFAPSIRGRRAAGSPAASTIQEFDDYVVGTPGDQSDAISRTLFIPATELIYSGFFTRNETVLEVTSAGSLAAPVTFPINNALPDGAYVESVVLYYGENTGTTNVTLETTMKSLNATTGIVADLATTDNLSVLGTGVQPHSVWSPAAGRSLNATDVLYFTLNSFIVTGTGVNASFLGVVINYKINRFDLAANGW